MKYSHDAIDKRIQAQREAQSSSKKLAQNAVPPMEYDGADSLEADGGSMFTTAEILDLAEGTDTYL